MCEKFYMERSDEPEWEEMFTQVASESRAYLGQSRNHLVRNFCYSSLYLS